MSEVQATPPKTGNPLQDHVNGRLNMLVRSRDGIANRAASLAEQLRVVDLEIATLNSLLRDAGLPVFTVSAVNGNTARNLTVVAPARKEQSPKAKGKDGRSSPRLNHEQRELLTLAIDEAIPKNKPLPWVEIVRLTHAKMASIDSNFPFKRSTVMNRIVRPQPVGPSFTRHPSGGFVRTK